MTSKTIPQVLALDEVANKKTNFSSNLKDKQFKLEEDITRKKLKMLEDALFLSTILSIGIFALVAIFLFFIGWVIYWQGCNPLDCRLSDKVLITLISTTTINIIGLLYLVIKYVFHHRLNIK